MMKSLTIKQFICEFCGKSFIKPSLLHRHFLIHSKYKLFKCLQCSQSFTQKASLQKHLKNSVCNKKTAEDVTLIPLQDELKAEPAARRETKNVTCMFCDRNFVKPSDLERHIRTHTDERIFPCGFINCNKSFKLKNTLERHSKTHEKESHICHICSSNYMSAKVLQNHMRLHSTQQIFTNHQDNARNFRTGLNVDNEFVSLNDLTERPKELNLMPVDTNQSDDKSLKTNPQRRSKKKFICNTCNKSFNKPIDLKRHSDAVHEKKRPFICPFDKCKKSFSLKCTLNRHLQTHKRNWI